MKLILKDKMQIAIKAMLDDAEKVKGTPKHIELSEREAEELLAEVHYLTNEGLNAANNVDIKWTKQLVDLQDPKHPAFLVRMVIVPGTEKLLPQTVAELIRFWGTGDIEVTCFGVSLAVDWSPIKAESKW